MYTNLIFPLSYPLKSLLTLLTHSHTNTLSKYRNSFVFMQNSLVRDHWDGGTKKILQHFNIKRIAECLTENPLKINVFVCKLSQ